ncbi:hypothetical protein F5X96DRAFT_157848 [Biscogniauxia mediterranea]|nr:hypothetical protein F5X96DRAFT_157848 [Biscogniauxia mediterranea]
MLMLLLPLLLVVFHALLLQDRGSRSELAATSLAKSHSLRVNREDISCRTRRRKQKEKKKKKKKHMLVPGPKKGGGGGMREEEEGNRGGREVKGGKRKSPRDNSENNKNNNNLDVVNRWHIEWNVAFSSPRTRQRNDLQKKSMFRTTWNVPHMHVVLLKHA